MPMRTGMRGSTASARTITAWRPAVTLRKFALEPHRALHEQAIADESQWQVLKPLFR